MQWCKISKTKSNWVIAEGIETETLAQENMRYRNQHNSLRGGKLGSYNQPKNHALVFFKKLPNKLVTGKTRKHWNSKSTQSQHWAELTHEEALYHVFIFTWWITGKPGARSPGVSSEEENMQHIWVCSFLKDNSVHLATLCWSCLVWMLFYLWFKWNFWWFYTHISYTRTYSAKPHSHF